MRKAFGLPPHWGQSLRIGVSAHGVSLLRVRRWRGAPVTVLAEHRFAPPAPAPSAADPIAIANALRALLQEHDVAGWPAAFVLADDLARMWRVTPPQGATRLDDLQAAAGLRFQALYGEPPSAWQIGADWHATQPFFAAAVPRVLTAALLALADECRLAVVGIEPQFVSVWNRWHGALAPGAWFALVHDGLMTLAPLADDGVRSLRVLPVPPGADQAWLAATLQREALLLDLPPPALLQACGAVPAPWLRAGTASAPGCAALDHAHRIDSHSVVAQLAWGGAP
ncbi:hypothetical protein ASF61_18155 [Duganella sp. Leaf126]|uniref:hypothetical protein n=1 Tax=Duganella sp. Leaf126 TaxID=1736266 RepID=UPI0006F51305|nr:hypothetical protein [Duganella sp. Leaf126]KQQ46326.1 hypothetical protein ASF61_18155 [Duganella sp. Leaf126]